MIADPSLGNHNPILRQTPNNLSEFPCPGQAHVGTVVSWCWIHWLSVIRRDFWEGDLAEDRNLGWKGSVLLNLCVCLCTRVCVYMCISIRGSVCVYSEWIYLGSQAFWQNFKSFFLIICSWGHILVAFLKAWYINFMFSFWFFAISWSFWHLPTFLILYTLSLLCYSLPKAKSKSCLFYSAGWPLSGEEWEHSFSLPMMLPTASLYILGFLGRHVTTLPFTKLLYWASWERSRGRTETPLGNPASLPNHAMWERLLESSRPPILKPPQSRLNFVSQWANQLAEFQEEQKWLSLGSFSSTSNAVRACNQTARCYCLKLLHVGVVYYTATENCSIDHSKLDKLYQFVSWQAITDSKAKEQLD